MRRYSWIALIAVFVLFGVALTQSVRTIISLSNEVSPRESDRNRRAHHISVFLPDQETRFFQQVRTGVDSVAERFDVAVSFHPVGPDSPEFDLARYSGIDGAIIYPRLPESAIRPRLDTLSADGIPIVLIERDVADDWPWTFVGTNNFEMGRRIGTQLSSGGPHSRVVVVYSDKSPAVAAERELVELGINTSVDADADMAIERRHTSLNPLDAEDLTYDLIRSSPAITALVFTDTDDTLAALQVIIDLNVVGQVQVIGFGVNDTIVDYLDRGILDAAIAVNPQRIGIEAVRVLTELITTGNAPSYVDTGVEILRGATDAGS